MHGNSFVIFPCKSIKKFGNEAEKLLDQSLEGQQLSITLNSGKVYIGYVVRQDIPAHNKATFVGVLPVASGYRDKNTQEMRLVTDYELLELGDIDKEQLGKEQFIKYFQMSDIALVSVYDHKLAKFFESSSEENMGA